MEEVCALKIRIKFRKYGVMKFIGHLDMMRYFQKAIRRSGIDICYSKGFSPHQIMSFAAPLGVGITSDGEYLDIEVHTSKPSEQSIAELNAVMAQGVEITGYVQLPEQVKPAMASVCAAAYEIWYKDDYSLPAAFLTSNEVLTQKLHAFFQEPEEILVSKKTKKGERIVDLKQLVYDFQIIDPAKHVSCKPAFELLVHAGSTNNIKPEFVLEAFYQYLDAEYNPYALQIHRKEVYTSGQDGNLIPLLDEGFCILS